MVRKEINEIKALFDAIDDCGIKKMAGCYVNAEKEKVKTFCESFHHIPEEEMYKYLEIFRKTLSGTPGKNLLDMQFQGKVEEKGKNLLDAVRASDLEDEAVLDSFYDSVIASYDYVGNYLILLINQAYDVPGMTTDGIEMDDASDEVYNYILCCICPMKLTRPGLGYDDDLRQIHTMKQLFAVELPDIGFLYPAFNERSADDGALLYYCKRADVLQDLLLQKVLDVSMTLPAKQQKTGFNEFVTDILGEESSFETVLSIQENLNDTIKSIKNETEGEAVYLDKTAVKNVFEKSGVSGEKLADFDKKFDDQFDLKKIREQEIRKNMLGKKEQDEESETSEEVEASIENSPYLTNLAEVRVEEKLFADNVAPVKNFEIKTQDMILKINSKHTDIVDTRIIDGKKYLLIELSDDLTVNGIPVK